jgi:predicted ribosome quality control (RQC) complex YloA/Tae2 family protein
MKVVFDLRKSVPDNANSHYERAKKLRAKIPGLKRAMDESRRRMEGLEIQSQEAKQPQLKMKVERKWFEKFRWFESTQGYLVLGGRDATSNEILIKKHMESRDLVFHADIVGAPFFIVKNPSGTAVPDETKAQAAQAAASYSRAWGAGSTTQDVYEVDPEQVNKSAPAGEYLTKGAFMVYGQKRWHRNVEMKVALAASDGVVYGGPIDSVTAKTKDYVLVAQGDTPQGALAKKVREKIGGELDDIQRFLPPGPARIIK